MSKPLRKTITMHHKLWCEACNKWTGATLYSGNTSTPLITWYGPIECCSQCGEVYAFYHEDQDE